MLNTGGVSAFSTDTRIVDTQRNDRIALEDCKAYRNGERFRPIGFTDWGFTDWGVIFAKSDGPD